MIGGDECFNGTVIGHIIQVVKYTKGGSHAVACFATSPKAFKMAVDISRRKGTVVAVGLPAGTHHCTHTS